LIVTAGDDFGTGSPPAAEDRIGNSSTTPLSRGPLVGTPNTGILMSG
jgi:hypothetical protein